MGNFQCFLERYHMDKWFRKENLIVMILTGVLLAVIALPTKDRQAETTYVSNNLSENNEEISSMDEKVSEPDDYASLLEKKLTAILSKIEGAGEVYVMITLQESEERIVEKDLISQEEQTVYESEGNASTPYVVKTIYPKVEGVLVIAQGAGTGRVTQHITEAVQALFDIELHKIKVAGS